MSPRIFHLEQQTFLGMAKSYPSAEEFDPEEVFFTMFIPNMKPFKERAIDQNLYAFPSDNGNDLWTYLAGCKVERLDEVPDGFPEGSVLFVAPAGTYVEFETTPHELGEIAEKKVSDWFSAHPEHTPAPTTCTIEVYPPECTSADSLCWILILLIKANI